MRALIDLHTRTVSDIHFAKMQIRPLLPPDRTFNFCKRVGECHLPSPFSPAPSSVSFEYLHSLRFILIFFTHVYTAHKRFSVIPYRYFRFSFINTSTADMNLRNRTFIYFTRFFRVIFCAPCSFAHPMAKKLC